MRIAVLGFTLSILLAGCGHYEPPPPHSLDASCDTGGRHGPSGVMDWQCTDGDGVERLRPQSLHEIMQGNDKPSERGDG